MAALTEDDKRLIVGMLENIGKLLKGAADRCVDPLTKRPRQSMHPEDIRAVFLDCLGAKEQVDEVKEKIRKIR